MTEKDLDRWFIQSEYYTLVFESPGTRGRLVFAKRHKDGDAVLLTREVILGSYAVLRAFPNNSWHNDAEWTMSIPENMLECKKNKLPDVEDRTDRLGLVSQDILKIDAVPRIQNFYKTVYIVRGHIDLERVAALVEIGVEPEKIMLICKENKDAN